jgi:hypothetical protein
LDLNAYKLQVVQATAPGGKMGNNQFAVTMLQKLDKDKFLRTVVFSGEATFHVSRKVNDHCIQLGNRTPSHCSGAH